MAALVGVDLVQPKRCVGGHRPPHRVVRQCLRPAHEIQSRVIERHIFKSVITRLYQQSTEVLRCAVLLTFARSPIVGGEHDDGVVPLACGLQVLAEPSHALVDAVNHAGKDLHVAGECLTLQIAEFIPGGCRVLLFGVSGRQHRVGGDDPELLLPGETLLTDLIPARIVSTPVFVHVCLFGLQRRVDRTMGIVEKKRFGRMRRANLVDHLDGLIGEVVGEVIVVGVLVDVDVMVVFVEPVGLMEVGETIEDSVIAFKALLEWPGVARPGFAEAGVLAEVPLANHQRRPPVVPEEFGHGHGIITDLMRIAGESGIAVRNVAHTGQVMVETGQHRRPSRRTHRVDVEVGVANTIGG